MGVPAGKKQSRGERRGEKGRGSHRLKNKNETKTPERNDQKGAAQHPAKKLTEEEEEAVRSELIGRSSDWMVANGRKKEEKKEKKLGAWTFFFCIR